MKAGHLGGGYGLKLKEVDIKHDVLVCYDEWYRKTCTYNISYVLDWFEPAVPYKLGRFDRWKLQKEREEMKRF